MSASADPDITYVVGNGPSLRNFNFARLQGRRWIGMNAAYRHWARTGRYPTHYICLDRVVGLSHVEAIADMASRADALGMQGFLLDDAVADAVRSRVSGALIASRSSMGWSGALTERFTTGSHAVLWAAAMGCDEIHLLGIDQNYVENVPGMRVVDDGALEVERDAQSPNYYFSDYQRVGDRLNRPNPVPHVHATAWRRVMSHMRRAHPELRVINHSPISAIPGTLAAQPRASVAIDASAVVTVPENARWRSILPLILPRRFTSLSVDPGLDPHGFGAGWAHVPPADAPHRGRWHLHVQQSEDDPGEPELGSVLFLPGEGASADWRPEGLHWFDHSIRVEAPDATALGVLALRLDKALTAAGAVETASPVRRACVAAERMARRALRKAR